MTALEVALTAFTLAQGDILRPLPPARRTRVAPLPQESITGAAL